MTALPPVSKVIRFDLHQTFGPNARVLDRIFLKYSGALSSADLATVLTTMRNGWNTNMAPILTPRHTLTSILGTDLTSSTAAQNVNSTASVGSNVDTDLPLGTALVIKFKINNRYRGGHPRFYLVGRGIGSLSNADTWTGATITGVASAFAAFIAAAVLAPPAAVGTLTHTSVNYFKGFHSVQLPSGRWRNIPTALGTPLTNDVVAYSVNPQVASQRRRNLQSA
jgi:hypothetical protein